jgi:serine protease AprX
MRTSHAVVTVAAVTVLAASAGVGAASAAPRSETAPAGSRSVVVMAQPGRESSVQAEATAAGLRVTRRLDLIHGFAAVGSDAAVRRLAGRPGVLSVSSNQQLTPMSIVSSLGYDPAADTGSLSAVSQIVGAQSAWAKGYTGKGVDVAVIDTGVSPVAGLNASGKVITGPDLSFDSVGAATPGLDAYGHGTFMAGLIAGRDATATTSASGCTTCLNSSGYSDTTKFVGIAPDARIVNVKVGAADGATDVTQVIAGIDWVVQHAHDPGVNIRVISLSFGTASTQAYTVDPLAQAAEQAWKQGIVVVAAAGNEGRAVANLADPAYDPYVLAVGGDDPVGTVATSDDSVPSFAQHGTTARPVDVIAPAAHVLGLRVPGSFIDTLSTNTGQVGTRFQRGSGTSEATAITSGVAALLAQQYPLATPDQIKALITGTATALPLVQSSSKLASLAAALGMTTDQYVAMLNSINSHYSGHGIVNAGKAVGTLLPASVQSVTASTGTGTLDAARGGVYVTDNGVSLTGQKDVFGKPFTSLTMATAQTLGVSWVGGVWNGSRWTGDGWTGSRWTAATWTGTSWAGSRWTGSRWTGMTWDGSRWTGSGWSGSRWTGSGWDGSRWTSSSWS